jgi:signal transduction histidine kinase
VLFVKEMVNKFEPSLLPGQKIIFNCDQDSCEVGLDRQLCQHILQNLISNAIKYSPIDTTITITLGCDERWVNISVADQGIGIPDSYRDKLFQLFERADNVGNIKGTGLGLSIVKKAIDLHSGSIEVESVENQGTTFNITLQCSEIGN